MITVHEQGAYYVRGTFIPAGQGCAEALAARAGRAVSQAEARRGTIAAGILAAHNTADDSGRLAIRFDCLTSHDITYVNIIQTAKASGLQAFPVPYVLTNCHNSLCAVGGTINEDDHLFGLSCARRYGGVFVPPHLAVIHTYMREMHAACGSMILGSDSHTRYGAAGALGIGEGGGELVKQLLGKTYDLRCPEVVAVHCTGAPKPGVGPHDVALALVGALFKQGLVKNKILEFVGEGVAALPMDFRSGIDTMTTETACLSSIWSTDSVTEAYFRAHGRPEAYKRLAPAEVAYYDGLIELDLSAVPPMIALPFHPSNAWPIMTVQENLADLLHGVEAEARALLGRADTGLRLTDKIRNGRLHVDQGVIAGCAGGTFDNLYLAAACLRGHGTGAGAFALSVYPSSQPVMLALARAHALDDLMLSGATVRTAFCGPCFGAGDVPANGGLSVRHTTRNFPNREGSKPPQGQMACVALMDARSIAATARNGGVLTAGTEVDWPASIPEYVFDPTPYTRRVYNGFGRPDPAAELVYGPNIADWPPMDALPEHLLLGVAAVITDPVTTTDELIPSGDSSSYRSNPVAMAEFTLSRREPAYVGRAKAYRALEAARAAGGASGDPALAEALRLARTVEGCAALPLSAIGLGSLLYANRPGDGSAREQAASCQRVLGGRANLAREYATKRYRSNLLNWGLLPLTSADLPEIRVGDFVFVPGVRAALAAGATRFAAYLIHAGQVTRLETGIGELGDEERRVLLAGCLMNFYKGGAR